MNDVSARSKKPFIFLLAKKAVASPPHLSFSLSIMRLSGKVLTRDIIAIIDSLSKRSFNYWDSPCKHSLELSDLDSASLADFSNSFSTP